MIENIINESILGLDFGLKKIGIAIKRGKTLSIECLGNFKNSGDVIKKIIELVKKEGVNKIVIGRPLGLGGMDTKIGKNIDDFIKGLSSSIPKGITLITVNENGTTKEAIFRLNQASLDVNKKKDTYSAAIIIERYIRDNV